MKISKKKLKHLVHDTLLEMNFRRYPQDFNYNPPHKEDVFDYAFQELIEYLVEAAEDEGLLFYDDSTQIVTDKNGHQVGHYIGTEFKIDEKEKLVNILKSNFKPDLYVDDYNEYQEQLEKDSALDAMELERDIRASEFDGDY